MSFQLQSKDPVQKNVLAPEPGWQLPTPTSFRTITSYISNQQNLFDPRLTNAHLAAASQKISAGLKGEPRIWKLLAFGCQRLFQKSISTESNPNYPPTRQPSPSLHHLTLCIYTYIFIFTYIIQIQVSAFFCTLYIHMYIVHTDPLLKMASNPWTNTPKLKHGKPFSCFNKNQPKDPVPPSPPDPLSLEPKHGVWLPGGASIWREREISSASSTATTPVAPPGSCLLSGSLDHHVAELQGQRQHGTESLKGVTDHGTIGQTPEPWCWGGKKND